MNRSFLPSRLTLTRRGALARLGAGGIAVGLATRAHLSLAQESTPPVSPGNIPPELQSWVDGWEATNAEQIASTYAEDAVVEVVPFGTVLRGREAIEQYYAAYFGAFDAPSARITGLFTAGDQAAAEWTFQGGYEGQLPGLPPGEGQQVSLRGVNVMEVSDGQIVVERIYTDLSGLLAQLGIEGAIPGTPAATPTG
ncbi:MAG TPA: nuclear transport factor 2 family protein [Thermomicrobiales bacterium]|nr:nuclear transport factor 2 family protein [Thermomicrobiales bacterium]